MIFARRSRSASAWRAIARCMPLGISTSFTSTIETLIPQGPVASSMIPCRIALIFSRSESSSSSDVLAEHGAQRRLRDLGGRDHVVLDLDDRVLRVDDLEVGDRVDPHRDVVLGDDLLRRDVERDRPEVDLHELVDDRDLPDEARDRAADRAAGRSGRRRPARTPSGPGRNRARLDPISARSAEARRRPAPRPPRRARARSRPPCCACQSAPSTKTRPGARTSALCPIIVCTPVCTGRRRAASALPVAKAQKAAMALPMPRMSHRLTR